MENSRKFGFYARPAPDDFYKWRCQICRNGYYYQLTAAFCKSYPLRPPIIHFTSPVFHPNIYPSNDICLDLLQGKWRPSLTLMDLLIAISRLLDYPNPNSPANAPAASLFGKDKAKYEARVKENNEKYHKRYVTMEEWPSSPAKKGKK